MTKAYMSLGAVPHCCHGCDNLDWSDGDYDGGDTAWCSHSLIFPTRKQECAMRNKKHRNDRAAGGQDE